ncbi:MAG: hypothetical protein V2A70_01115, partial [Candidatus Omnitrophota bacterium]
MMIQFCRQMMVLIIVVSFLIRPEFAYAQSLFVAQLPEPGMMVNRSASFTPVLVKGMVIHPDRPLNFDFIVDSGNISALPTRGHVPEGYVSPSTLPPKLATDTKATQGVDRMPHQNTIEQETLKMAKYFLAALTVPEKDLWVNLSPHEKDRVIEKDLGETVLGRDMLAQDYLLKQLIASLIYPEKGLGKQFWDKVYAAAMDKYGTTDIPVDTFNKVWIMPDKSEVFEKENAVYVTQARLKVLLDSDYVAMSKGRPQGAARASEGLNAVAGPRAGHILGIDAIGQIEPSQELAKNILREVIVPAIENEINEGKNFAPIRQIYHAAILAKWYREKIKNTLLTDVYVGKNMIHGVTTDEKTLKEEIYQRYIAAYKNGVYNYISEGVVADHEPPLLADIVGADPRVRPVQGETTQVANLLPHQGEPRQYFSGGEKFYDFDLTRSDNAAGIKPVGSVFKVDASMVVDHAASSIRRKSPAEALGENLPPYSHGKKSDLNKKPLKEAKIVNPYVNPVDTVEISEEAQVLLRKQQEQTSNMDETKDQAQYDKSFVTSKYTHAGRNVDVQALLVHPQFRKITGVDLTSGDYTVIDVGVGSPPQTTIDMKEFLSALNPRIDVIGTELPQAEVLQEIVFRGVSPLFDRLVRAI